MKWNNKCQYTPASLREKSYEELYTLCLSAYTEGRTDERNKSLEAYRLRCSCLFGNKCMDSSLSVGVRKRICDGNCHYIKKYMSEPDKPGGIKFIFSDPFSFISLPTTLPS
ncbi:hypothetical protein NXX09_07480 [Bacteroides uniformis]|nr:hypothetical protein [Bacteroides uniformis]